MTRVAVNDTLTSVTIVEVLPQRVVRHKTQAVDGYNALVVGVLGKGDSYRKQKEFNIDANLFETFPVGSTFDEQFFENGASVAIQGTSKGKWYAGPIKKHGLSGLPATHGHKFTRTSWSKGNRKPRRGFKWYPHAWHMGTDTVTLKNITVLQTLTFDNKTILVLKWSLPGAFNSYLWMYK